MANFETCCHICHISFDDTVSATHDCLQTSFELEEKEIENCQPGLVTSADEGIWCGNDSYINDSHDCHHDLHDNYADVHPEKNIRS